MESSFNLLSVEARSIVNNEMSQHGNNSRNAYSSVMAQRIERGWEATSSEGAALRDAENYLTNYTYAESWLKLLKPLCWLTFGTAATPVWQAKRFFENLSGVNLHSQPSYSALIAGYQGANEAITGCYSEKRRG